MPRSHRSPPFVFLCSDSSEDVFWFALSQSTWLLHPACVYSWRSSLATDAAPKAKSPILRPLDEFTAPVTSRLLCSAAAQLLANLHAILNHRRTCEAKRTQVTSTFLHTCKPDTPRRLSAGGGIFLAAQQGGKDHTDSKMHQKEERSGGTTKRT